MWVLFVARGAFYCALFPLWEGWDEYAHFGYAQHVVSEGTLPVVGDSFSREIAESMRLAPLPDQLAWLGPPYLTHSAWWALPPAERAERRKRLAALSPRLAGEAAVTGWQFYEAQQPPLYYWLLSAPLSLAEDWPLQSRVLLARVLTMLAGSLTIPLVWCAVRALVGEGEAILAAALLAVAPGFAIDVSRVADDALAVALTALLLAYIARRGENWLVCGVLLGLCLLSKAYLLTLVPALGLWWVWRGRWRSAVGAIATAAAVAGWWYARNVWMGHSMSGWLDRGSPAELFAAMFRVHRAEGAWVVAKSFTWFGGWSFLTLRSWMYAAFVGMGAAALAMGFRSRARALALPLAMLSWHLVGISYGILVGHASHGVSNVPGWYLWPMGAALAAGIACGPARLALGFTAALAAVDLYGAAALLAPYYAGLVPRNHADAGAFVAALSRLGVSPPLALVWVAATVAIPVVAAVASSTGRE